MLGWVELRYGGLGAVTVEGRLPNLTEYLQIREITM